MWALGVTFFEIVVGRTPFELEEGEDFSSKGDLERYWNRTNNDLWVGTWSISPGSSHWCLRSGLTNTSVGLERLLKAMLRPDPDQRLTAREAQSDSYFTVASGSHSNATIKS